VTSVPDYPWYAETSGDDVEQGDIFEGCRVFHVEANLEDPTQLRLESDFQNVIVMTQSCDMVKGRSTSLLENKKDVVVCGLVRPSQLTPPNNKGQLNSIRAGRVLKYHLLAKSDIPGFDIDFRIVAFDYMRILPLSFVRAEASSKPHLRLLPPLPRAPSQAFATYFMRIGLPANSEIPEF
jgi:hypothetical protein